MTALSLRKPRRLTYIPLLSAAGAVVFIFESLVPMPIPWVKLGLSNIAVLLAVYYFGLAEALAVSLLRLIAGALFLGALFTPAFVFGLCGGLLAVLTMWLLKWLLRSKVSPLGISVAGSAAHNFGQLAAARYFFIGNISLWNLLPFMILTAVGTGIITGLAAYILLERFVPKEHYTDI